MLTESCIQLPSGVTVSCEHFKLQRPGKMDIRAEIDFLNEMLYIWIGSAMMHELSNLQIAYPGSNINSSVSKLIIGEDSLDSANQLMAKRLSQKFGVPVILSFNCRIEDFEEQMERLEIFKWIVSILETRIKK